MRPNFLFKKIKTIKLFRVPEFLSTGLRVVDWWWWWSHVVFRVAIHIAGAGGSTQNARRTVPVMHRAVGAKMA